jgi:hypothetical protein
MTPLGQGILTGMSEVEDPQINSAMSKMLGAASAGDLSQTVLDMGATITALCGAISASSNTPPEDVLACVLAG